jgi:hypothetical protein
MEEDLRDRARLLPRSLVAVSRPSKERRSLGEFTLRPLAPRETPLGLSRLLAQRTLELLRVKTREQVVVSFFARRRLQASLKGDTSLNEFLSLLLPLLEAPMTSLLRLRSA